jgi:cob(I)alamin adenosyltransferase
MIFLFTGNGKGKTTSALGQALRVVGQGGRVLILQFIKSKNWPTGEEKAIKVFGKKLQLFKGGKGFVGIMGDKLPFLVHKKAAKETLKRAKKEILSGKYNLVVLDEINVALVLKLLSLKEVLELLKLTPKNVDLILTGRGAPKELIKRADLVTNFQEIKHPFQKGVWGKKGIEY